MKRSLIAASLMFLPLSAWAAPAKCLLEVDGKAVMFGPCNAEREGDGSLSIGTGEARRSPYFAIVNSNSDGSADAFWNGEPSATHAHDPLGTMRKNGSCWLNDRAKVCAWPLR